MTVSFDTLAAAEAMESVGVEPRQARVIATQLQAATSATEAVTRPEMEAALATLKTELLDRMAQSTRGLLDRIEKSERGLLDRMVEGERGLLERMAESERGLLERMTESERRTAALLWRLFGAMVAVAGLAVAVIRYLP